MGGGGCVYYQNFTVFRFWMHISSDYYSDRGHTKCIQKMSITLFEGLDSSLSVSGKILKKRPVYLDFSCIRAL